MPTLYVLQGSDKGRTYQTGDDPTILGRHSDHVPLTDHSVSREHARLHRTNGAWTISDCRSSNGTYLNGHRLSAPTVLKHGDQIRVGGTLLVFNGDESIESFSGPTRTRDLVELDAGDRHFDSSILASAVAGDESVILATPVTSDAVHAWNVIYQIAETVGAFETIDEFLERMTDIVFRHLRVDRLFILMRDGDEMVPRVVRYRTHTSGQVVKITTSQRIIQHVRHTKEGVLCANAQSDVRFGPDAKGGSLHQLGLTSVICVPILIRDEVAGIIHMDCGMARHTYNQQQLLLATTIGRMAGMAIENHTLVRSRMERERLAAVGETVAHLSHSIRNILQGMRSGADVIEMGLRRGNLENVSAGWQIVQRNLERTYGLATNMLTYSQERRPQMEMAQANAVLQDVIGLHQRQADDKGVVVSTEFDDLPAVPLDVDGIHQAVGNILINAIDAVPKDTGRVRVFSKYDENTGEIRLSLSDNGPGIAEEDRERVFTAFHSTKGHRGTGLGLAAARKIVEEHGGTIDLQTSPKGTTFTIRLNTAPQTAADSDKTHGPPK
ncbi:MAG: FHA domain-containing protein [Phycisphaerales bacterium]|nr:FHA domain-containing protein [Phycisphaerales bacterium]